MASMGLSVIADDVPVPEDLQGSGDGPGRKQFHPWSTGKIPVFVDCEPDMIRVQQEQIAGSTEIVGGKDLAFKN